MFVAKLPLLSDSVLLERRETDNGIMTTEAKRVGDASCDLVLLLFVGDGVDVGHFIDQLILRKKPPAVIKGTQTL